ILKDTGHYRVANFAGNFMSDGATSYFHKSIGGYHAAKLGRYQELVDFHIQKNNLQVLNMLHTKYLILPDENRQKTLQINAEANGNAWFVNNVLFVDSADAEMAALATFNSKTTAVVNRFEFPEFASAHKALPNEISGQVQLQQYQPNALRYATQNKEDGLLVFSEIYYKEGWNAYIDGELQPHYRANYVLRALPVPKGEHMVEFKFEPTVIANGSRVVLFSILLFFAIAFYGGVQTYKNNKIARSL
ncbi:MAG: YfhO family protein, partial [Flavicella sp.]|nr:YfhO family protein [Flavicella sp.]